MEFKNKTVIITGAASGMGQLSSQRFCEEGANVVMLDVNEEKLKEQEASLRSKGYEALGIVCDIRKYENIEKAINTAKEKYGSIDITIGYAGGSAGRVCQDPNKKFKDYKIETIDWGIDVNFRAPIYMARAVLNIMIEQKSGIIINIGSVQGVTGGSDSEYAASKAGMIGLTKSLSNIGAQHGIRCLCVSPGPVLTRANMANMKTPMGRAAEPIEIVDVVMFLCSDKASFITGINVSVDGGRACAAAFY